MTPNERVEPQWVIMATTRVRSSFTDERNADGVKLSRPEDVLTRRLVRAGYEAWAPMVQRTKRQRKGLSRRTVPVLVREPWYQGYIFVNAATGLSWFGLSQDPTMGVPGVGKILAKDGYPAIISPAIIKALRQEVSEWCEPEPSEKPPEPPRIGEMVRVRLGRLGSLDAPVCALEGFQAVLDVMMLGKDKITVDWRVCERIEKGVDPERKSAQVG